ncbi:MAG TPA: hypothetical protein VKA49_18300 [Flavitalea sp.]|nr:hypothetical protein [Flavitalea sp.]
MFRLFVLAFVVLGLTSCSKSDNSPSVSPIPDVINGAVISFRATPLNITTPDKSFIEVSMQNVRYMVTLNAVPQSQSNALVLFATDTVLVDDSKEFANLGKDAIAYHPVSGNEITIRFNDGRKIFAYFDFNTDFGGTFGEALISTWRVPNDPAKPTQKARDDLKNFLSRYNDADGTGPGISPTYFFVDVSKL